MPVSCGRWKDTEGEEDTVAWDALCRFLKQALLTARHLPLRAWSAPLVAVAVAVLAAAALAAAAQPTQTGTV